MEPARRRGPAPAGSEGDRPQTAIHRRAHQRARPPTASLPTRARPAGRSAQSPEPVSPARAPRGARSAVLPVPRARARWPSRRQGWRCRAGPGWRRCERCGLRGAAMFACITRPAQLELTIRPARLGNRPRMPVESADRPALAAASAHAAPAAPVPQPRSMTSFDRVGAGRQRLQDLLRHEQVLRTVEKGEGRALALRRQGAALGELRPALDVARRQRAQRARHLAHREVGKVALARARSSQAVIKESMGTRLKSLLRATRLPVTC